VIFFHRKGAKGAERKYFLFAVERPRRNGMIDPNLCINGRPPANKKKSILCALGVFAVKFKIIHLQGGQIIGWASVDYT
jgi:hypothetical protein